MGQQVGIVKEIQGKFKAVDKDGRVRVLKPGDPIYEGDEVYSVEEEGVSRDYVLIQGLQNSETFLIGQGDYRHFDIEEMGNDVSEISRQTVFNTQTMSAGISDEMRDSVFDKPLSSAEDVFSDLAGTGGETLSSEERFVEEGIQGAVQEQRDVLPEESLGEPLSEEAVSLGESQRSFDDDTSTSSSRLEPPPEEPQLRPEPAAKVPEKPSLEPKPEPEPDVNSAPELDGSGVGSVTEVADGALGEGTLTHTVTGSIGLSDDEGDVHTVSVTSKESDYLGTFTPSINEGSDVSWEFSVSDADLDYLQEGESIEQIYTITVDDGNGGTASETVTITINGTGDAPLITSDAAAATGAVTESGSFDDGAVNPGVVIVSGTLTASDTDSGDTAVWSVANGEGAYGSLLIDASTGRWTYSLDNTSPATQALEEGKTYQESFVATVTDSHGKTAVQEIIIDVQGTNDAPVISSSSVTEGQVVEAGEENDGTAIAGTATVSGLLVADDVDADSSATWSIKGESSYGKMVINPETGEWTYTLDNSLPATQTLEEGQEVVETFTATVIDDKGAVDTQTVSVTIQGSHDRIKIEAGGDLTGSVTESPDDGSGEAAIHIATGTLEFSVSHVDDIHTVTATPKDGGAGYIGTFTPSIDAETGNITWKFQVSDADMESLKQGDNPTQVYTIEVDNGVGGTDSVDVTITLHGSNEAPDAKPDTITVIEGNNAVGNVLNNDSDDAPQSDLFVTQFTVNGQTVQVGDSPVSQSITAEDGTAAGTLVFNKDGSYEFTPAANWHGEVPVINYTVSDGAADGQAGTDSSTLHIVVHNNSAPLLDLNSAAEAGSVVDTSWAATFTENGAPVFIADSDMGILNVDSQQGQNAEPLASATIVLTNPQDGDVLDTSNIDTSLFHIDRSTDADGSLVISIVPQDSTGRETVAHFVDAIKAVTFANTSEDPDTTDRIIKVHVNDAGSDDGSADSNTAITTITVAPVDDAPEIDLNSAVGDGDAWDTGFTADYTENGPAVAIADADMGVTDVDTANLASTTITLTNTKAGDMLDTSGVDSDVFDVVTLKNQGDGDDTVVTITRKDGMSPDFASFADAIKSVTFKNSTEDPDTADRRIDITVNDGHLDSKPAVTTIHVAATNDMPVILEGGDITGTITELPDHDAGENSSTLTATGELTLKDIDALDTHSVVSVTPKGEGFAGELAASVQATVDPTTDKVKWTFSVNDADLDSLKAGETLTQVYTVTVQDNSGAPASQDITITLVGSNEGPQAVVDSISAYESVDAVGNVLTNDSDPDAPDADLTVKSFTVEGMSGTFMPDGTSQSITLAGNEVGQLVFHSDGAYTFTPVTNWNGDVPTITYTVVDTLGGEDSATLTISILDNAAPIVDLNSPAALGDTDTGFITTYTENGAAVSIADSDMGVANLAGTEDESLQSATIVLTNAKAGDHLDSSGIDPMFQVEEEVSGDKVTVVISAKDGSHPTFDDFATAIKAITFKNTSEDPDVEPRLIQVHVNDGNSDSNTALTTINIVTNDDSPTIDLNGPAAGDDYAVSFTEGDSAVSVAGEVELTDIDTDVLDHATITLKNTQQGDSLDISGVDTTLFTVVSQPGQNVGDASIVTITRNVDQNPTKADFAAAIEAVTFTNTTDNLVAGDRVIDITVNDGHSESNTAQTTITVTAVNDAPTVDLNGPGAVGDDFTTSYTENQKVDGKDGVSIAAPDTDVSDVDTEHLQKATITLTTAKAGDKLDTSDVDSSLFTVDSQGATAITLTAKEGQQPTQEQFEAAIKAIRFSNTTDDPDTTDREITVEVNDGALNSNIATTTITVDAVNDAPIITGGSDSRSVAEKGGIEGSSDTHEVRGSVTFTDADAADTHTVIFTPAGTQYFGDFKPVLDAASGKIDWTFSVKDKDIDSLPADEEVTQTYTIIVKDDNGGQVSKDVTITINGANDAPVITSDAAAAEGSVIEAGHSDDGAVISGIATATGTLTSSDVDADSTATWSVTGTSDYGSMVIDPASGKWTYTLDNDLPATQALKEGETKTETFTATVTDDKGATATEEITVTINGTNDKPVITSDVAAAKGSVTEDTSLTSTGILTSSDVDADSTATWSVTGTSAYGSMDIDSTSGKWTYTLDNDSSVTQALKAGETKTETFTTTVTDDNGATATQEITVTITGTNDKPVITSDAAAAKGSVTEAGNADDGAVIPGIATATGTLTSSDVDADSTAAWSVAGTSAYGSMAIDSSSGKWTYTLDNESSATQALKAGETKTETFTATVIDDNGATATQEITVTITGTNDKPVITSAAAAAEGSVTEAGHSDDGAIIPGVVTATGTLTSSDIDADSTATWSVAGTSAYGSMEIDSTSGKWTYTLDNDSSVTQALKEGETKTETFTATVTDDNGVTATQEITVTITGTNDKPVITSDAAAAKGSVTEAGNADDGAVIPGTATATGTLTSSDVDADSTAAWSVAGTSAYGSMAIDSSSGKWTYTLDNDSSATQALKEGETKTETFTATVTDDNGATATQEITVTITGTNDKPVITSDAAVAKGSVTEAGNADDGAVIPGIATATGTLTSSDVDADSTATWSVAGTSAYGSMAIDSTSGKWTYTLNNESSATQALKEGETKTETFTATVTDDNGATATQEITVTITGTNDKPVITSDAAAAKGSVTEAGNADDGAVIPGIATATGTLTSSDVDADSTAAWSVAGTSAYGSMAIDSTSGKWTYTLDNESSATQALKEGETKTETFTATVTDDKGATATQEITITIKGTNDAPVIAAGGDTTASIKDLVDNIPGDNTTQKASGTLNFSDVDTGTHTVTAVPAGSDYVGTFTPAVDSSTGKITWDFTVPDADIDALKEGETKTQTYTITVDDGNGGTASRDVTITINGHNDELVAVEDTNSVTEDGADQVGHDDNNANTTIVAGDVRINDTDSDDANNTHTVIGVKKGWEDADFENAGTVNAGIAGDYGTVTINADGTYTYALDNTKPAVQGLSEGKTLTETFTYTIEDSDNDKAHTKLVITINGTNDDVVITAGGDLAGTATEIADKGAGENQNIHIVTGELDFTDNDSSDSHTVSVEPNGSNYLGEFTPAIDSATGKITWEFHVPDADLDSLDKGDNPVQTYTITVADGHGSTVTKQITITLVGANEGPDANPDSVVSLENQNATGNVLINDADEDGAEDNSNLKVTGFTVDGTDVTIPDGTSGSHTIAGKGTITIGTDGDYTFVPATDWHGTVPTITYTITDNDGGTAESSLVISVINNGAPLIDLNSAATVGDLDTAFLGQFTENGSGVSIADIDMGVANTQAAGGTQGEDKISSAKIILTNTKDGDELDYSGVDNSLFNVTKTTDASGNIVVDIAVKNGGASHTEFEEAIKAVKFNNTTDNPAPEDRIIHVTVNDGNSDSNVAISTIEIITNDDPPKIDLNSVVTDGDTDTGFATSYTENGSGVSIAADDMGLYDIDTDSLALATITLTNTKTGDVLDTSGVDTSLFDVVTLPKTASGATVVTITKKAGQNPGLADMETAIKAVKFKNTSDDPDTESRSIEVKVNDGHSDSNTAITTIAVTKTNDAPVLTPEGNTSGTVTEIVDGGAGENVKIHKREGTFILSDADAADSHTVTVDEQDTGYLGTFTPKLDAETGRLTWKFTVDDSELDHLKETDPSLEQVYTITVDDGHGGTISQNVTITLTGTNDAPEITSDTTAAEGTVIESGNADDGTVVPGKPLVTGQLEADDVDTSDTAVWSVNTTPTSTDTTKYGDISINSSTGEWEYTLDNDLAATQALKEGESVVQTFTATVTDGGGATATQDITVTITGANDVPVIADTSVVTGSVTEDAASNTATGTLTATDPDAGDTKAWSIEGASNGAYGSIAIDADGQWTYTLDNSLAATQELAVGETKTETFTAKVTDSAGATAEKTITVTITGANDTPEISVEDVGQPNADTDRASLAETDTTLTATGTLSLADMDISDNVSMSVESVAKTGTYTGTLPSNDDLKAMLTVTGGLNNTQSSNEHGVEWRFDSGSESFNSIPKDENVVLTYTVKADDGHGGTTTHDVTITITGTNDTPMLQPDTNSVTEDAADAAGHDDNDADTTVVVGDVLNNDSDIDGDTLSVVGVAQGNTKVNLENTDTVGTGVTGTYGTVTINADGTYDYALDNTNREVQALAVGESRTDTFTYTASDGNGGVKNTTLTITINGANDDLEVVADTDSIIEDAAASATGNVLTDDSDIDGDTLKVVGVAKGDTDANLESAATVDADIAGNYGTVTINADGDYSYSLDTSNDAVQALAVGESLTETFTYTASDGNGGVKNTTLTITIDGANDTPEITVTGTDTDNVTITETDTTLTTSGTLTLTDLDTSDIVTMSVESVATTGSSYTGTLPANDVLKAMFTVSGGLDGSQSSSEHGVNWSFDSGSRYFDAVASGETVKLTYTVKAEDDNGAATTHDVIITIKGTNDAPQIQVLAEDATTRAVIEADGTLRVSDTLSLYDIDTSDTVSIAKVAGQTVAAGGTFISSGGTLPADLNNAALLDMFSITGGENSTTAQLAQNGAAWTFDSKAEAFNFLAEGETLTLSYKVQATDSSGAANNTSAEETITITITGTNDAPVVRADTNSVGEDTTTSAVGNVITGDDDGVLHNNMKDTDVDHGDTLAVTGIALGSTAAGSDNVTAGSTSTSNGTQITGTYGTLTIGADGSYSYQLDNTSDAVQNLAKNQSEADTFTYTVKDSQGATQSTTLTINVTGTNDAPVISKVGTDADSAGLTEDNSGAGVTASGKLSIKDVDTTDSVTASVEDSLTVSGDFTSGSLPEGVTLDELKAMLTVNSPVLASGSTENEHGIAWKFDAGDEHFNSMQNGDQLVLTYRVKVDDGNGGTHTHPVTITITGTNDSGKLGDPIPIHTNEDTNLVNNNVFTQSGATEDPDANESLAVSTFTIAGMSGTYNAGNTSVTVKDSADNIIGTFTLKTNGDYTFAPVNDYSGPVPQITYTATSGGAALGSSTLDITVDPVADKPTVTVADITTREDTAVILGLNAPTVKDADDVTGRGDDVDNPELLGPITLTLPTGVQLLNGANVLATGGTVKIVLSDDFAFHNGAASESGVISMTTAEYQSLKVKPVAQDGNNFTVDVSVTSFEVDNGGNPRSEVNGATTSKTITVDVQAVTDPVDMKWNTTTVNTISGSQNNVHSASIDTTDGKLTIQLDEDSSVNLKDLLGATFNDTDRSEHRWVEITGLPEGAKVGTQTVGASGTITLEMPDGTTSLPDMDITPPKDFSGDMPFTVTLYGQDRDYDSNGGNSNTPHLSTKVEDSVTVDFQVRPVGGDVAAREVSTNEDTATKFLDAISVTDTGTNHGTEKITGITIKDLPEGWVIKNGSDVLFTGDDSTDYTVSEAAITDGSYKNYTATPPAHSSKDIDMNVTVTTQDTQTVGGTSVSVSTDKELTIPIKVAAMAEKVGVDSDGDGSDDLNMNGNVNYTSHAIEDEAFDLNSDFAGLETLKTKWNNEDSDEQIFALFKPEIWDASQGKFVAATNATFTWDGGSGTYNGSTAVEVPKDKLDSLKFQAPPNASGEFRINVVAKTVDTDPDTGVKSVATSGEAVLTNLVVKPAADKVTLGISQAQGNEDSQIPLDIRPTSSDADETFNVTLDKIPDGGKIFYDEKEISKDTISTDDIKVEVGTDANTFKVTIIDYDSDKPPKFTPPLNSDEDITLDVSAVSVDTVQLENGTILISEPATPTSLGLDIKIKAISDGLANNELNKANATDSNNATHEFTVVKAENTLDADNNEFLLKEIYKTPDTLALADSDGSETATFKVTGLADDFSVEGGAFLGGSGESRVWAVTLSDLQDGTAKIQTPAHYSGKFGFEITGITTEKGGDSTSIEQSISVMVTPDVDATLSGSVTQQEDAWTKLDLSFSSPDKDGSEGQKTTLKSITIDSGDLPSGATIRVDGIEFTGSKTIDISEGKIPKIEVLNPEHSDANYSFPISYVVVDTIKDGANTYTNEVTKSIDYSVAVKAVTDTPTLTLDSNNVTVDVNTDEFTKTLTLTSPDTDGSEDFTRIKIENVPNGLDVENGIRVGAHTWYVDINPDKVINSSSGVNYDIVFKTNGKLTATTGTVTIKAITQDGSADENSAEANFSIDINTTDTSNPGSTVDPAEINTFVFKNTDAITNEEEEFTLGSNIEVQTTGSSDFSIKITSNDSKITISGANKVGDFWLIDGTGDQQVIIDKLNSITVTPSEDFSTNDSNDVSQKLQLDVELTTHGTNGLHKNKTITNYDVVVKPITDKMDFDGTTQSVDVDEDAVETLSISLANTKDGTNVTLEGNVVYIKADDVSLIESLEYDGVNILDSDKVNNPITGLTGEYYEVYLGESFSADQIDLTFTPKDNLDGDVSFEVYVPHKETHNIADHDSDVKVSKETFDITINAVADIPTVDTPTSISGDEDTMIEVPVTATISDSSENIANVVIKNIPDDYLVYYGKDAANATQADNMDNGTWSMKYDAESKIFVKPPENKGDDIQNVTIEVISDGGETDATSAFDITVNPVADGLTIDPTKTFGNANEDVDINLNPTMIDTDGSETVTLKLAGFGVGNNVTFNAEDVAYDTDTDTYTITDISHDELGSLKFQTEYNINNKSVTVTAQTVETANSDTSDEVTKTFNVSVDGGINYEPPPPNPPAAPGNRGAAPEANDQATTIRGTDENDTLDGRSGDETLNGGTGDDTLDGGAGADALYGGLDDDTIILDSSDTVIDGGEGTDTLKVAGDQDFTELGADLITDMEVIDLEDGSQQTITLDSDSVKNMTGEDNTLLIKGDTTNGAEDTVKMDKGWTEAADQETVDNTTYNVFDKDNAHVKIEDDVTYHIA